MAIDTQTETSPKSSAFSVENWPGLILGLFTFVGVSLIALGQLGTEETIALRHAEDLQRSLAQVIPDKYHDNDLLADITSLDISGNTTTVYQGMQAGQLNAVAFTVSSTDAYGGPMEILVGIDVNGVLLGVRVLSHTETPGLGDKVEIKKSNWIKGFDGKALHNVKQSNWAVKKDGGQFDAFSGATITPRAVVKAVHLALQGFRDQQIEQKDSAQ